jgi:alpha-galactosidase
VTAAVGDWVVRGILPVISSVQLRPDGTGLLDMWGEEVPVVADGLGAEPVLRTGADAPFPLEIQGEVDGDILRLGFTNVGVRFDLTADRVDDAGLRAHRQSLPRPLPAPLAEPVAPTGVAAAPPMGWNSWFGLRLDVNDRTVREIANALVTTGLRDAGYAYVTLDDGWQGGRDADGTLLPNRGFPDMAGLGAYLHERGLRFGIYSSPGPATCADYTGSFGHEEQDARTFASWGVDYLKYDWCSASALYRTEEEMRGVLQKMGRALRAAGRPVVFSLCQYGAFDVPRWGASVGGNLWRVSYDVEDAWESIEAIGFAEVADPEGGWNDLDMLQIGLGNLTASEYRTQLTVWAMRSAPLILSCDPRALSSEELAMLTNPDMIAIDQDPLGRTPVRHRRGDVEIWVKALVEGEAVAVVNRGEHPVEVTVAWDELGLTPPSRVQDVWAGRDAGDDGSWAGTIDAHASVVLRIRH